MNFSKIKNLMIVILVMTAVYQTGLLWLEDFSGHNFFYSMFGNVKMGASQNEVNHAIAPQKIIFGMGTRRFNTIYPSDNETINETSFKAIEDIVLNGYYAGSDKAEWDILLSSRIALCVFPFIMSSQEYEKGFTQVGSGISSNIETFDIIALVPPRADDERLLAYFINTETSDTHLFISDKSSSGYELYKVLNSYSPNYSNTVLYTSAKQSGFNLFAEDTFVPQWEGESTLLPDLEIINPYINENGETDISLIEQGVEMFFKNSSTKWSSQDESGVFLFSNDTSVVKYYPSGVQEYYNYMGYKDDDSQTLATAYSICMDFLDKDIGLYNDIYLSSVSLTGEGLSFYFDYTINNMPVELGNDIKERAGISHAIEVVVQNNSVRKYRRYICDIRVLGENKVVNVDFLTALDSAINSYSNQNEVYQVEDIYLGYMIDVGQNANVNWFIELDDNVFVCKSNSD